MTAAALEPVEAAHPTGRAILYAVAAVSLFAAMNALSKHLTASYPVAQVVWARYSFAVLACLVAAPWFGPALVRTRAPGMQAFRAVMILASSGCFIGGLSFLPLPVVEAIAFASPLLVVALSAPLLKERVGWRTWAAVAAGFAGVLLVVRPGGTVFQWAALLPLAAALFYALAQIATRPLSRLDPSIATLFYSNLIGALLLCAIVPFAWRMPDAAGWGLMLALGLVGAISHFLLIRALSLASAALLQPFTYAQLLWALALGYAVFGYVPDAWSLLGGAVIAASGLYVAYRGRA